MGRLDECQLIPPDAQKLAAAATNESPTIETEQTSSNTKHRKIWRVAGAPGGTSDTPATSHGQISSSTMQIRKLAAGNSSAGHLRFIPLSRISNFRAPQSGRPDGAARFALPPRPVISLIVLLQLLSGGGGGSSSLTSTTHCQSLVIRTGGGLGVGRPRPAREAATYDGPPQPPPRAVVSNQSAASYPTTTPAYLDFGLLASKFDGDRTSLNNLETLIQVINDTRNLNNTKKHEIYGLVVAVGGGSSKATGLLGQVAPAQQASAGPRQPVKRRRIVYEDTIFLKRALREIEGKMTVTYEGESKSDPAIHWMILYNDTTILVVRSANKYYYWTYGQTVGSIIIFVMIVVGNLSILHRLKSSRRRRSNVNYFIVQLAIADLMVGVFCVTLDSWLRIQKAFIWGLFACRASKFTSAMLIYASTNLLVALSIDRWEAVVKPLAFTKNRSRGYHLVAASWLLAVVFAAPITFVTKIKEIDGLPQCWIDLNNFGWRLYLIYLTSLLLVVPTLIIAVCYIQIVYTIWCKSRLVSEQQLRRDQKQHLGPQPVGASPEPLLDCTGGTTLNGASCLKAQAPKGAGCSSVAGWIGRRLEGQLRSACPWAGRRASGGPVGRPNNGRDSKVAVEDAKQNPGFSLKRRLKRSCTIEVGSSKLKSSTTASLKGLDERLRSNRKLDNDCGSSVLSAADSTEVRLLSRTSVERRDLALELQLEIAADKFEQQVQTSATRMSQSCSRPLVGETNLCNEHARRQPAGRPQARDGRAARASDGIDGEREAATGWWPARSDQSIGDSLIVSSSRSSVARLASLESRTEGEPNDSDGESSRDRLQQADGHDNEMADGRPGGRQLALASVLRDQRPPTSPAACSAAERFRGDKPETVGPPPQLLGRGPSRESKVQSRLISSSSSRPASAARGIRALSEDLSGASRSRVDEQKPPSARRTKTLRTAAGNKITITANSAIGGQLDLLTSRRRDDKLEGQDLHPGPATDDHDALKKPNSKPSRGRTTQKLAGETRPTLSSTTEGQDESQQAAGCRNRPQTGGGDGGRDQDFVACQQHGSGVIPKARIKTIKMTLVIVLAYILCWSPFLILNLCGVFDLIKNDTNVSHALLTLSQSLAHLNSAVNPIIFWLFSSRRSQTNAAATTTAGPAAGPAGGAAINHNQSSQNAALQQHHFDRPASKWAPATSPQVAAFDVGQLEEDELGEDEEDDDDDNRDPLQPSEVAQVNGRGDNNVNLLFS